jgi:hypothetical protein
VEGEARRVDMFIVSSLSFHQSSVRSDIEHAAPNGAWGLFGFGIYKHVTPSGVSECENGDTSTREPCRRNADFPVGEFSPVGKPALRSCTGSRCAVERSWRLPLNLVGRVCPARRGRNHPERRAGTDAPTNNCRFKVTEREQMFRGILSPESEIEVTTDSHRQLRLFGGGNGEGGVPPSHGRLRGYERLFIC